MNLYEAINEKAKELSLQHIAVLEKECKEICERYNIYPEQLIIEFHTNNAVNIKIQASSFKIINNFTINGNPINEG